MLLYDDSKMSRHICDSCGGFENPFGDESRYYGTGCRCLWCDGFIGYNKLTPHWTRKCPNKPSRYQCRCTIDLTPSPLPSSRYTIDLTPSPLPSKKANDDDEWDDWRRQQNIDPIGWACWSWEQPREEDMWWQKLSLEKKRKIFEDVWWKYLSSEEKRDIYERFY